MARSDSDRALVRRAREHLDEWTYEARDRAFEDMFEGEDAAVTVEELHLLDRIDSDLTRRGGTGLWGVDRYGIVAGRASDADGPTVVCTYHPEIPFEGYRDEDDLDESTRDDLNDVLWDYCERVAELLQAELDAFVREARAEER